MIYENTLLNKIYENALLFSIYFTYHQNQETSELIDTR